RTRGRIMDSLESPRGTMASIAAPADQVQSLIEDRDVVIANLNSARQTVISGDRADVEAVIARARSRRIAAVLLPVSHAFHSPYVAGAVPQFLQCLAEEQFSLPRRRMASTVTGAWLKPNPDVSRHLCDQITCPVQFTKAIAAAMSETDIWIEIGPGRIL